MQAEWLFSVYSVRSGICRHGGGWQGEKIFVKMDDPVSPNSIMKSNVTDSHRALVLTGKRNCSCSNINRIKEEIFVEIEDHFRINERRILLLVRFNQIDQKRRLPIYKCRIEFQFCFWTRSVFTREFFLFYMRNCLGSAQASHTTGASIISFVESPIRFWWFLITNETILLTTGSSSAM